MGRADTLIRRSARGVVVALTAIVVIGALPGAAGAVTPALLSNVVPALPATLPTTVAVVAHSAPVGADVGIVVRNGTTKAVERVKVVATAKVPGGGSVVRATTTAVVPQTLSVGGLAIGNLKFGKAELPSGTTFSFKVTSTHAKASAHPAELEVREALLSRPMEGPVAQELAVTVANLGAKTYSGPMTVMVMCFGEAANPAFVTTTTVKTAKIASGATAPATVTLRELCPQYMVGASSG
jgi:hypothetical protein